MRNVNVFLNPDFCTIGKTRFSHIPHSTDSQNVEHFHVLDPFFCITAEMILLISNITTGEMNENRIAKLHKS